MKKFIAVILALVMGACLLTGCSRESDMVSYNIGKEADNFNVTRRLTSMPEPIPSCYSLKVRFL